MDGSGNSSETHGSAIELLNYGEQEFPIHFVEAKRVNFHPVERIVGDFSRYAPIIVDFGIVSYAAQETINDPGSAARATGDFARAVVIYLHVENSSRTFAYDFEVFVWIKIQMEHDSEASPQRRGQ